MLTPFHSTQLLPSSDASLRIACCRCRASSVSEHDSSCALSCFRTASPVTVTCGCELIVSSFIGCWFELPDARSFVHQVSHRSFQPCPMNFCSGTHSSRKLFHGRRVVVLPHREVGPSPVDTILPTLLGVAPLSPSLSLSLEDRACSQDCTSPCPCL